MESGSKVLTLGVLFVLVFVACAPAAATDPIVTEAPAQQVSPSETPFQAVAEPTSTPAPEQAPTEEVGEVPQPVTTSRGSSLEATAPSTVSLASGELQLVEFFRYT